MNLWLKISLVILCTDFILCKERISETKCADYSRIRLHPAKQRPYLVYLKIGLKDIQSTFDGDLGTLVSDQFVITSAYGKSLVAEKTTVHFSENEFYKVREKFLHPTHDYTGDHAIALLKLEEKIRLDSLHRPACLWTRSYLEPRVFTFYWSNGVRDYTGDWTSKFDKTYSNVISLTQCRSYNTALNFNSLFVCIKPVDSEKDAKYNPTHGCGFYVEPDDNFIPNNTYIMGTFLFYFLLDEQVTVGTVTEAHLDWYESIIWNKSNEKCGTRQVAHKPLITFSSPTYHGEFPWHIGLHQREGRGIRKYICGGSLINQNTVVTAAHCVQTEVGVTSPSRLYVSLGKYDLDITTLDSRETRVEQVLPHENYNRHFLENDIAILKLQTLVDYSNYIQPICIPDGTTLFDSDVGIVSGWGRNEKNELLSELTKASLPIRTNEFCRNSNRNFFPNFLNDRNFCAGYQNGTNVCTGDSGGGLVTQVNSQFYLRGIVSLGVQLPTEERCDITQLVLFTDVSKFHEWINDKL